MKVSLEGGQQKTKIRPFASRKEKGTFIPKPIKAEVVMAYLGIVRTIQYR